MTRLARALALFAVLTAAPASSATITVNAGGDLQAAINAAKPGDTIMLQAGATFTGEYKLPAKGGTAFITIRSATADSSLPPAGSRISPSYSSKLARLRAPQSGSVVRTMGASSYWRLMFLEILPSSNSTTANLIDFGSGESSQNSLSVVPQHLVIDRCYIHGDPTVGLRRGLALNSGETQVLNSYFSDFKQQGQDTQAIAGWNGPGPYLIENNYIEGSAMNIAFGGSDPYIPNMVPSNITIRRNLIAKPLAWRTQSWTIKNLLELKNAQDVLIEGNVLENVWTAGQQGYAIVLTPRNQDGHAPWSVVKNVTIRHNIIRHAAGGFNILGYDDEHSSQQTQNIDIVDNLVYDIGSAWGSSSNSASGMFALIGNAPKDITIDHNTVDNGGGQTIGFYAGQAATGTKIYGFVLTNNLLRNNRYGVYGDALGTGSVAFNSYTPNAIVLRNTFAGGTASQYPTGNFFPTLAQWLADFVAAASADYRLASSSLSNNSALDGTDIGVNFTTLNAAMSGGGSTPDPPPPPPPPPPPTSTGSTPYGGTAAPLPGTVQFENYDAGGIGVAYQDTTSGNTGGAYRSNNVDIQATSDSGGGYDIAWVQPTEWLNYTVNVKTAGTYALDFRVAANGAGGVFHVEVNGVDKTGPLSVPNTGGWQTWTTLTRTGVTLSAGVQVIRVVMDKGGSSAAGYVGNFNKFTVR